MVYPTLVRMLAEIIGVDEAMLSPDTALHRQNGIEPIDVAKLVIQCERAFHITIHDEDVSALKLLGELAAYIDERLDIGREDTALPTDREREAWYYE